MLPARDEILMMFESENILTANQIWEKLRLQRDDLSCEEVVRIICQLVTEKKLEAIGEGDGQSVLRLKQGKDKSDG